MNVFFALSRVKINKESSGESPACGAHLDRFGLHAAICETGGARYRPRNAVRDAVVVAAKLNEQVGFALKFLR